MKLVTVVYALFIFALLSQTNANEVGPKVGEAAPELRVSEWLKGEPIKGFVRGQIYVVEFWATWCGPCILAMPHLSDVQRQFADKGVTVIAVNVMEKDLDAAKALIKKMAKSVENHIALDAKAPGEKEGAMEKAWLGEDRGIPRCLIVDRDTKIAWIGHPTGVESPLHAIVAGTYDSLKQAEIDKSLGELDHKLALALKGKKWGDVLKITEQINEIDPFIAPLYHAYRIKAWIGLGDYSAASKFVNDVAGESKDMRLVAGLINQLLHAPDKSQLNLDFVLATAKKASRNGESDEPIALVALARAFEAKEDHSSAITIWKKVLELGSPQIDNEGIKVKLEQIKVKYDYRD